MKILFPFVACILIIVAGKPAFAEEMRVSRTAFCAAIVDREPVQVNTFNQETDQLYFFSEIIGATDNTSLSHRWYHNDRLVLDVELTVNGPRWRTWSVKNLYGNHKGSWRVEIVDIQGRELGTASITLE